MQATIQGILARKTVFTAGDLREGLEYLPLVYRLAVIFGLEQRLAVDQVIETTYASAYAKTMTPFAESAVAQCPRHIRLNCLFWTELPDGLLCPLLDLEEQVRAAFGGMSWGDLRAAYSTMVWIDHDDEASKFLAAVRQQGLL